LLLCVAYVQQAPIPDSEVPQRHEILNNRRVTVSLLELGPNQVTPMHKHNHDMLAVFLNEGHTQSTLSGKRPAADKMAIGEVRFRSVGYTHAVRNEGTDPFRVVIVDFADPQGKLKEIGSTSKTCNPDSPKTCVDEKNLFCTTKVCVED